MNIHAHAHTLWVSVPNGYPSGRSAHQESVVEISSSIVVEAPSTQMFVVSMFEELVIGRTMGVCGACYNAHDAAISPTCRGTT